MGRLAPDEWMHAEERGYVLDAPGQRTKGNVQKNVQKKVNFWLRQ
jgi:hypothetical protein